MSAQYQVNIAISAGADFAEEFYLASPDKAPLNITGCKFIGALQKHPGAYNAITTTSEETDYVGIPFATTVSDGVGGVYRVSLPKSVTSTLEEGKYVYSVSMTDVNGVSQEVVSGLAFVSVAFAGLL